MSVFASLQAVTEFLDDQEFIRFHRRILLPFIISILCTHTTICKARAVREWIKPSESETYSYTETL